MPTKITDAPIRRFRGVAPLTGGQAPATTQANRRSINMRSGFEGVLLETVTSDSRVALCPRIVGVYWEDVSAGEFINLLEDGPPASILDSGQSPSTVQFTLAAADFLYIGFNERAAGAFFEVDSSIQNDNASTSITAAYGGTGGTLPTSAITDGTSASSVTMTQNGPVTFDTVPAEGTWIRQRLSDLRVGAPDTPRAYWMQIIPSALLDAVEIEQLQSLTETIADTTADSDGIHLDDAREYTIDIHEDVGALEYWSGTVSANSTLNLTWIHR